MSVSNELIGPQFLSYNCGEGGSSLEVFVIAWLGIFLSVHIVTVCIFNLFLLLAGLLQKQYFNNNELMILSSPNQAALRKKLF